MHTAVMLDVTSEHFQLASECLLLTVGGLGLRLNFQERGPHSQGTKSTWHSSCKWGVALNGY